MGKPENNNSGDTGLVKEPDISGGSFGIYPYKDDFIIHGELEIARADRDFNTLWTAGARDIFVTQDGSSAFEMDNGGKTARDWSGNIYNIGYDGSVK